MNNILSAWKPLLVRGSHARPAPVTPPGWHRLATVSDRESAYVLSLGAGVQSTALLLLAAEGRIPRFDFAIFADTGWEPRSVYEHLDRLESEVAKPAGIHIERVKHGNIRTDSESPDYTLTIPLYVQNADGSRGMMSRQCTQNYKLIPIYRFIRTYLGAHTSRTECVKCEGSGRRVSPGVRSMGGISIGECSACRGMGTSIRVGPVPDTRSRIRMAIGFSTDEITRVSPSRRAYVVHDYPLLDLGWSRHDALNYLQDAGFPDTPRSACIGCPYHHQVEWDNMRRNSPQDWAEAVAFDSRIRDLPGATGMTGKAFLHRSCLPLDDIPQSESSEPEVPGCSPFGCRTAAGVDPVSEQRLLDADEQEETPLAVSGG